ncbi:flagellar basal body rod protein FlgC [bacterium]|nr:flagellar basal body rod protein FlgC [bacterium]
MGFYTSLNVAATGLSAHRQWMDLIAGNVANVNTTRTAEGGPYTRKLAVFQDIVDAEGKVLGVKVGGIGQDTAPARLVYEPGHPDANAEGYVAYPNVNIMMEMVDLISASRAYEANISSLQAAKEMAQQTLSILT